MGCGRVSPHLSNFRHLARPSHRELDNFLKIAGMGSPSPSFNCLCACLVVGGLYRHLVRPPRAWHRSASTPGSSP